MARSLVQRTVELRTLVPHTCAPNACGVLRDVPGVHDVAWASPLSDLLRGLILPLERLPLEHPPDTPEPEHHREHDAGGTEHHSNEQTGQ